MSGRVRFSAPVVCALALALLVPRLASAQQITPTDRLCDPGGEDCRDILLNYINNETVGIDVAFWFMEDARYSAALIARWNAGVPVRVIIDPQANSEYPLNKDQLAALQQAGIPMRKRNVSSILHWKTMIFAGQGVVEFSGANYSADAWHPLAAPNYSNYIDEAIFFTSYPSVVTSFKGKYDDLWTDTTSYTDYANITSPPQRLYGDTYQKDPELNFPPGESYAARALKEYAKETSKIDVIMYRITDQRHADAMIDAFQKGIHVRMITEPEEYRNPKRAWDSYNIDRMYMAGIPIKMRAHEGLNHQKTVLLYDHGMVIFGSSNWSEASANAQQEHNYFTQRPEIFNWFAQQFERKWNNSTGVLETADFVPQPPDRPTTPAPALGATGLATTGVTLKWYGGPWGQLYDVYFGTDPSNLQMLASNVALGPSESATQYQSVAAPDNLLPGTTYYWRVVTKTMANLSRTGDIWSFTTAGDVSGPGTNGTNGPGDIVLYASKASVKSGTWTVATDTSAAGAAAMWNKNKGAAKVAAPLASPANYFDLTFTPKANTPYHLWVRARADNDSYANDSVYVQFSNSIDGNGFPVSRIGTASAQTVILEDCDGCGEHGWGWTDNGYAPTAAPPIIFDSNAPQTMRIQVREDGLRIDQVMLSPVAFFTARPGLVKDDTTIYTESTSAPDVPTIVVTRQPFLQQVSSTGAAIVWATTQPGPAEVRVSTGGGAATPVAAVDTLMPASRTGLPDYYQHVAMVGGLSPSTSYDYDIVVQGVDVNPGQDHFTTAPGAGTGTVKFLALGDGGTGSTAQQQIAALMGGETFDFVLHAGDVAYGASNGTGDASYQTYQDWFFSMYAPLLRSHAVFPTNGNHDSRATTNWGQAYLDDFVLPANGATAAYPDAAERMYSFDYGPMHVVVLDTEYAFSDPARLADEKAWLDADLAATAQPWKVALFHRPPYSSGGEHGSSLDVRAAFDPIFEARGVQLVISGHEHDYERTTVINGVTYVVTGGAGAPLYPNATSTFTAYSDSRWHYMRGTATPCTIQMQEVGIDAQVYDQFTLSQCASLPDTEPPIAAILSPAAGATVKGAATVQVSAADNVAVTAVDLAVDGTTVATTTASPFTFTWDTTAITNGAHALQAIAHDAAGNTGPSAAVNVTVSNPITAPGDIVLYGADGVVTGTRWTTAEDSTAAGGRRLWNPNQGNAKIVSASAAPSSYVEFTFNAVAGQPYHLWIRSKAEKDYWANDSLFLQFSGAVTSGNVPTYRIGTTSAVEYNLEDCSGCNVSGWGWQDNGWGVNVMGPNIYFETSGPQTLRLQQREDGISVDQIMLSPGTYLTTPPGTLKNDTTIFPRATGAPPDTTAPLVTVTSPAEGATISGPVAITADATDNVGVSRVELWVDDTFTGVSSTTAPYSLTWTPWTAASGVHTVVVKAIDAASNVGSSAAVHLTYTPATDAVPPAVAITAPANGATINDASTITVDASDDVHVSRVELWIDGAMGATTETAPYTFAVSALSLAAGSHTLTAKAVDPAGNVGSSATITVTVDATPPPPADIVLYTSAATITGTKWEVVEDATAAGGARLHNPDAGAAKITTALASPASYAELTFTAIAGQPYHLWMRAKADGDSYKNDSAFLQFSDTVDGSNNPTYRIGSTSGADWVLEECNGCNVQGWGWHDNSYGKNVLGPNIVFATTGTHTIRIQQREDGISIDQIVLSPVTYLATSPGVTKNDTTIVPKS